MMCKEILVICTLKEDLVLKYEGQLSYVPLTNQETDESFEALLRQYKPKSIVFGLQAIDEAKLSVWRRLQPDDHLTFVRKGTSLHRVDFAAAKKYEVNILNTAGVNSPFVADFVVNLLFNDNNDALVGILGIGDIGKKVAIAAMTGQKKVLLYNRTLHPFEIKNYQYVNNLMDIFSRVSRLAICLPLTAETTGIITAEHINALPKNAKVVCVSPPRVMAESAILALDKRQDLHIIFDHVDSGLHYITQTLGRTQLRENFIFEEKAAADYECQYAMGEAAIMKVLAMP